MTIEAKYGVPTVAMHTDKFVKVVRSVADFERLLAGEVLVAKPTAPARMPSRTICRICAISASVATRCVAASPITYVRTAECPTKHARLRAAPWRSSVSRLG